MTSPNKLISPAAKPANDCCEPPSTDVDAQAVGPLDLDQLAAFAKALGHPMRLRIVRMLIERRSCVTGDLVAELPLAQSTISEHLRILREAGLIQGEIEGPRVSYCVNRAGLGTFTRAINDLSH